MTTRDHRNEFFKYSPGTHSHNFPVHLSAEHEVLKIPRLLPSDGVRFRSTHTHCAQKLHAETSFPTYLDAAVHTLHSKQVSYVRLCTESACGNKRRKSSLERQRVEIAWLRSLPIFRSLFDSHRRTCQKWVRGELASHATWSYYQGISGVSFEAS